MKKPLTSSSRQNSILHNSLTTDRKTGTPLVQNKTIAGCVTIQIYTNVNPNPESPREGKNPQLFPHIYMIVNLPEVFQRLKRCQLRDRTLIVFQAIFLRSLTLFASRARLCHPFLLVPETVPILNWGGNCMW